MVNAGPVFDRFYMFRAFVNTGIIISNESKRTSGNACSVKREAFDNQISISTCNALEVWDNGICINFHG